MSRARATRRKKEISPAVMEALLCADRTNPPSVSQPLPPPTMTQIQLVMNLTDDEQHEYPKIGRTLLEEQRPAWHAERLS